MRRFQSLTALGSLLLLSGAGLLRAQQPPLPPPDQTLSPQQLENLVAPIALYPDPLLGQIMVASTYPLEVVEAFQWLQRSSGLTGSALTEAAQQQNWDPSVQALVVFPDVLKRLNDDVTWMTNLGNAFLAQQAEVMDAVQRLRQQAQQAGKLNSTPQETVTASDQGGMQAIEIEPADPDVMYVPVYNPAWIWGPALWYPYPGWYWPPPARSGHLLRFRRRHWHGSLFRRRMGRMGRLGLASRMGRPHHNRQQHVHSPLQFQFRALGATARNFGMDARRFSSSWRALCAARTGQSLPGRGARKSAVRRHPGGAANRPRNRASASAIEAFRRAAHGAASSEGWGADKPRGSIAITVSRVWGPLAPAAERVPHPRAAGEGDRRQP